MNFGVDRRKRWYVAAIGGLAGASGLAAIGVATATDAPAARTSEVASRAASADQPMGGDSGSKDARKGKDDQAKQVPCDSDILIAALVRGNAEGVANLELEPKCTYTLTAFEDGDGLPLIVGRIKIEGNGATIVRAAAADPFRIFHVGFGGDLKLRDLTVKGGDARTEPGGGGLLVDDGGKATVEGSTFTLNRTDFNGGAIANFGVTRVLAGSESDGGKDGKEHSGKQPTEIRLNTAIGGGGAVVNFGSLTVDGAKLTHNDAQDEGGGLANAGVAKLTRTQVDNNHAADFGGGVDAVGGSTTELRSSSVSDNTAGVSGGGISGEDATLYLRRVDVRGNTATALGGGIDVIGGRLVADEIDLSENSSLNGDGGGAYVDGTFVVRHSEVKLNRAFGVAGLAGGFFVDDAGSLSLSDTRVVENASTVAPGGITADVGSTVTVDDDSTIIKNRPTNCEVSPVVVPNCFG